MPAPFSRSLEAVRAADQSKSLALVALATGLIGAWGVWVFAARVTRYEVSEVARLEVGAASHRVAAPLAGRVVKAELRLDAEVEEGQVLLELDDQLLRAELEEKLARLAALEAQLAPLEREAAARARVLEESLAAGRAQVEEAQARAREAETKFRFEEQEAGRAGRLLAEGLLSEAEAGRSVAGAAALGATAEATARALTRVDAEQRRAASALAAELAQLERETKALDGERRALLAASATLRGEIERHRIRAPVAGKLGEISALRPGAFLRPGDPVATVVPRGDLSAVAEFGLASVGRLAPGQTARVRLFAFPWTEFGTVPARVLGIGTEAHEGRVRVELALEPEAASAIRLQHGLPGEVVVEVERVSPATLLLRAAGQLVRTREHGR